MSKRVSWADGEVLVVVSARMRSARCPGKAVAPLAGKPLLTHLLERLRTLAGEQVVLATSESPENDGLVRLAETSDVSHLPRGRRGCPRSPRRSRETLRRPARRAGHGG